MIIISISGLSLPRYQDLHREDIRRTIEERRWTMGGIALLCHLKEKNNKVPMLSCTASNIKYQESSIKHPVSSIEYPVSSNTKGQSA
jgi:hypothetical protein